MGFALDFEFSHLFFGIFQGFPAQSLNKTQNPKVQLDCNRSKKQIQFKINALFGYIVTCCITSSSRAGQCSNLMLLADAKLIKATTKNVAKQIL